MSALSRLLANLFVASAALLSCGLQGAAQAADASDLGVYFAPLPPLPQRSGLPFNDGAPDFADLFRPGAQWDAAARNIDAFVIYSTWVRHYASSGVLVSLIKGLQARGIALAMEVGPLPDPKPGECTGGESFGGVYEIDMLKRIRDLGGRVDAIVFDEPFAFGHQLDGPDRCHWPIARIARHLGEFEALAREVFPSLIFGGNEPLWASPPVRPQDVVSWVEAYRAATGRPLGFLHLDIDWTRPDWLENAVAVRSALAGRGVRVGYIYNGGEIAEQKAWIEAATNRAVRLEAASPVAPDDVVFASWFDQPDRTLPDSDPTSFTGLVKRYFDPHAVIALDPDGGPLAGHVHTPDGVPIPGATVRAAVRPTAGAPGTSTVSGTVPAGADTAVVIFRANGEGATDHAKVDLRIDRVGYREGGGKNRCPQPGLQTQRRLGWLWRRFGTDRKRIPSPASAARPGAAGRFGSLQGQARCRLRLRGDGDRAAGSHGRGLRWRGVPRAPRDRTRGFGSRACFGSARSGKDLRQGRVPDRPDGHAGRPGPSAARRRPTRILAGPCRNGPGRLSDAHRDPSSADLT